MLDDSLAIKRGQKPHRSSEIGAREAERILGVSRAVLNKLAKCGQLPGRLLDSASTGRRRWVFKMADVLEMKNRGNALRAPPHLQRIRVAWVRLFGEIPHGFTVIARDQNSANVDPQNLALVPLKTNIRERRYRLRRRKKTVRHEWTRRQLAQLRKQFPTRPTSELAAEFGTSVVAVRARASQMRLRKTLQYLSEQARKGKAQAIGTERICKSYKNFGMVMVKVTNKGKQSEQWRPKHHVMWAQANGRPVPPGFRVIFKDGNKQNMDPANLELTTREALGVSGFARFFSYPPPLQSAIRLTKKLEREVARQKAGVTRAARPRRHRVGVKIVRWTQALDELLRRDYATMPRKELAASLGVSVLSLRCRATRLGLKRSPAAMIAEAQRKAAVEKAEALRRGV